LIDLLRFFGLRQIIAYFKGDKLPLPDEPLTLKGVYALVRHPLYLFTLMFLWFNPAMTAGGLGLVMGAALYFISGPCSRSKKERFGRFALILPPLFLREEGRGDEFWLRVDV